MVQDAIVRKLKTLTAFRVFFVTILLGTFFIFQIGYNYFPFPASVLYIIIFLYAVSIAYSLLLGKVPGRTLAYVQLGIDTIAVVVLIFLTGGIESWFSSLMLLTVISAAIVMGRNAGYLNAILSSIFYGSLVDLQFYNVLPIPHDPLLTEKDFLFNIFAHMLALYLTAYLIGHLVTRLEKKDTDIEDLTLFNREVIENTPSGLFTADLVGRILVFNRAAEKITGIPRSNAYGRNMSEVFPFIGIIDENRRIEDTVEYDGRKKVIGLTVSRMNDTKGNETGYIGVFQDLTEFKRMAKEIQSKEKWAAIGELSANIAHEIRNPLASLKGSIELMRENSISPEQKEKLMSIALSEMDRLNHIIADFLTYSRPITVELQTFDLSLVLDKTMDLISSRTQQVAIHKNYSGPIMISADPLKLEQVFLNLGINALDAMPHGGSLEAGVASNNGIIEITFKDTGEGIGPDDQEKIFYPFFTTKSEGTGLGLSIVHRIIEDHKGRISLLSSPGKGTTFSILLPGDNVELQG